MLRRAGTLGVMLMLGCSGAGDSRAVATPPSRSGVVWEVDSAADRAAAPGAMLAFANGLHVMVIDGDDVYAGMKKLHLQPSPDGGRTIDLGGGETARLVQSGEGYELHFSSGETVRLRKQDRNGGNT
jgi:hypothetical protein